MTKLQDKYRGWTLTYNYNQPLTGKYTAERFGVVLSAGNRVGIERLVDQRIRDYPPNGD
jgi:hypothetical protein